MMRFVCQFSKSSDYFRKCDILRKALDEEISRTNPVATFISSEYLVTPTNIQPVADFLKGLKVKIVVYLRRHDSWWESLYNQILKSVKDPAWEVGFENFLDYRKLHPSGYGNYRILIDRWAEIFGPRNIVVRPFENQQNKPDIVVDVLRVVANDLGIDISHMPEVKNIRSLKKNISLSSRALQFMELYKSAKLQPHVRNRLIRHICTLPAAEHPQSILSPVRRLALIEENAADYEYIAREYMDREDGRLFYDPLPNPNEPWAPLKPLSPQEIVEETIKALEQNAESADVTA